MGKVRQAKERLPCAMCNAAGYSPCISRTTGKEMKSFHCPRAVAGRHDAIGPGVRKLDGMDAEFWAWSWMFLGCSEASCPEKLSLKEWAELYRKHPEVNPANQYKGEW